MKRKIFPQKRTFLLAVFIILSIVMTLFVEEVLYHFVWTLIALFVCIAIIIIVKKKESLKSIGILLLMFVGSVLIGIALSLILPALGINFDFRVQKTLTNEEAGTFEGKILNNGWVSETEDYIFYISQNKDEVYNAIGTGVLVRRDRDWTERTEITKCLIDSFVVDSSYVFYADVSDGSHLYRMNYDGTNPVRIIDEKVYSFTVADDIIYYSTVDGIFKLDYLNSNTPTKLSENSNRKNMIVKDRWVYFSPADRSISRVKDDGTQEQQLQSEIDNYYVADNGFYYTKMKESTSGFGHELTLYKQELDTLKVSEITRLDRVNMGNFSGNYMYYGLFRKDGMPQRGLYRINLDGTDEKRINKIGIWQLNTIQGNWMYIVQYSGFSYRIKLDGSAAVVID